MISDREREQDDENQLAESTPFVDVRRVGEKDKANQVDSDEIELKTRWRR